MTGATKETVQINCSHTFFVCMCGGKYAEGMGGGYFGNLVVLQG